MRSRTAPLALLLVAILLAAGCAETAAPPRVVRWWAGHEAPAFDPDGPPDALRASIDRLLTRSLLAEDSLGNPALDVAERLELSADRHRYTFHLPNELRFTDGSPCEAEHFRAGFLAGLARTDHATRNWVLAAVRGTDAVRARRVLPEIGVLAPDRTTLVFELARPDGAFIRKLASPGASSAWKSRDPGTGWGSAIGLGPYRVERADARSITLARANGGGPDTVAIRFATGAARVRTALRSGSIDLLWPLPPALLDQPIPAGFSVASRRASPARRLTLVLRGDVPPTTRLAARRAFAHGIARGELVRRLGRGARETAEWLPGSGAASLPGLDRAALQQWLERGGLGRSFHVRMAFDADGTGASVARALEGDLARSGLSADLVPLRGAAFTREALLGQAHALLVEEQGLIGGPLGVVAPAVLPMRGPPVGSFRSGFRTREFDPWLLARNPLPPFDVGWAERRLEEETILVPLCDLDWIWITRDGAEPVSFHPRSGPAPAVPIGLHELPAFDR